MSTSKPGRKATRKPRVKKEKGVEDIVARHSNSIDSMEGSLDGSCPGGRNNMCSGCNKPISERFLLKALDQLWHEDCLKCSCCDCRLGEVGSTLYTRANLILCKRDYLRLFGLTGTCSACTKQIPAFEMVMRAKGNNYHLECFACQKCHHRFCVGDKFYLDQDRILCESDCGANNNNNSHNHNMHLNHQHQHHHHHHHQQQQQQQQHHPHQQMMDQSVSHNHNAHHMGHNMNNNHPHMVCPSPSPSPQHISGGIQQ